MTDLSAIVLNGTLKRTDSDDGRHSSTDVLCNQVADALRGHLVDVAPTVRVVDLNILPGVTSDEGPGDDWPDLRRRILDADILVVGTPIWLGQPSSVIKRVLERMDAFLGETDDDGRMVSADRVAVVAVVGNEDGAHHVSAELFQALVDVGFTIPAGGVTYWVGEAMHGVDYRDVDPTPEPTAQATATLAAHAAHLAAALKDNGYPSPPD
ncbi:MAG TPA: NAD(P)H-dependent oxidoreductase [Acidimicrobiales bacterium]|nr:NAD(P)H-dependent oxidoreductase [Acidimicrobiales bacterium]